MEYSHLHVTGTSICISLSVPLFISLRLLYVIRFYTLMQVGFFFLSPWNTNLSTPDILLLQDTILFSECVPYKALKICELYLHIHWSNKIQNSLIKCVLGVIVFMPTIYCSLVNNSDESANQKKNFNYSINWIPSTFFPLNKNLSDNAVPFSTDFIFRNWNIFPAVSFDPLVKPISDDLQRSLNLRKKYLPKDEFFLSA